MPEISPRRPFVIASTAADGRVWRLELGKRTVLMGVLNLTPDSFSDGGDFTDPARAEARAREMASEGADLLDVGGESTRPGASPVPAREQLKRVIPVLTRLEADLGIPISVDTTLPEVARETLAAGVWMINDTSALAAPGMAELAAAAGAPVVLMHMRGNPRTMQQSPVYRDVTAEVGEFLSARARLALASGIGKDMIILDPGIGFGKTLEHNLELLAGLPALAGLGFPILVGPSRKSFIGLLTGRPARERAWGSAGAVAAAVWGGAHILRVHEPGPMRELTAVLDAVAEKTQ